MSGLRLRAQPGVVPQRGYLDHVGGGTTDADINVFGPLARGADDLDLLIRVLAGPPPERAPAWRVELPEPRATSLADYRIGVWIDDPLCPVESGYRAVLSAAVDSLSAAGAQVQEAHPPVEMADQLGLFYALITPAMSPSLPDGEADTAAGRHAAWLRNQVARQRFKATWAQWFTEYDLLLCPVTPTPAIRHQQEGDLLERRLVIDGVDRAYVESVIWTGLIGLVELPSAVPPIGRTAEGLPVGVQVVAPYLHDREAVRAAGLIAEAVGGGYDRPPGF